MIKTFHSSGRWDASAELLERNVHRMRREGRVLGTRTELTTASHDDALSWPDDGWGVYHPRHPVTGTLLDCAVEWKSSVWKPLAQQVVILNPVRLRTEKGFLLPQSAMPLVTLKNRADGKTYVVGSFHMQLANTERRRAAWRTEASTIRALSRRLRQTHPGWEQIFQGDGNRNQRITALRLAVQDRICTGTKLHNCWVGHLPQRGGTHGPRSILDLTLSTCPGASYLLDDDASSDHRPFGTTLR